MPVPSSPKERIAFWCPPDVSARIQSYLDKGTYQDRSKAVVGLLRKALKQEEEDSPALSSQVQVLAQILERTPEVVIRQCVDGILQMVGESGSAIPQLPLIVAEAGLRLKRKQGRP